ncbi:MAG: ATP-binding cassette domain-containing protein [Bacilli bacterium]|nr:ATP-binding cassette domain-containing protein [Bacilli bacterium]
MRNGNVDSFVSLQGINKVYPNGVQAVYDFNLDINKNDFIVLVGPSGCGKSTTLRMVAGLEDISSGYLYIDGVLSNYLPSKSRDISMVFQSYALYPQMSVYENIAFPLRIRKYDKKKYDYELVYYKEVIELLDKEDIVQSIINSYDKSLNFGKPYEYISTKYNCLDGSAKYLLKEVLKLTKLEFIETEFINIKDSIKEQYSNKLENRKETLKAKGKFVNDDFVYIDTNGNEIYIKAKLTEQEIRNKVFEAATILDLGPYLDRLPKELSGGQMQRVALGRAIVRNAKVFLMDEPLSNLDAKLRVMMRSEIVRIHEQIGATTIYVTHDQTEAMTMATKIVVMSKGWVQQVGTPKEVYSKPNNLFVAKFIGSPAMNIFDGTYNEGTITLDDGFKVDFGEKLILAHKKFYTKKIEETERLLSLLDTDIEGEVTRTELAKIFSAKSYAKNEKEAKDIDVLTYSKKKKKKIFAKKAVKGFDLEETRSNLNEMLAKYKEAFTSSHTIKLGIRPENIHVASTYKEKDKSASFVIEPNVVELLGGEYLLHSTYNGIEMIAKVPATLEVKAHEQIKLVMSKNLIHIFDEISGERIDLDE